MSQDRFGECLHVVGQRVIAPTHQGQVILPVLGPVTATRYTDRVAVRLVSGQSPADLAGHAEALAHGFGAILCRVRTAKSGRVVLEFVRRDALAAIITALPIPVTADLKALAIGRREDGSLWLVRLHGTHLLVAGATGAGKGSIIWGLIRALFPMLKAGLVRLLGADPKWMELSYGREIFARLEAHYRDMCDTEFTIDQGKLWMLQTRVGKRTGRAALRMAVDMVSDPVITLTHAEAVGRALGDGVTTRNWATVRKLHALTEEHPS